MKRLVRAVSVVVVITGLGLAMAPADADGAGKGAPVPRMARPQLTYQPVTFADLPEWARDDHAAALKAFRLSCRPLQVLAQANGEGGKPIPPVALLAACAAAARVSETAAAARAFFEKNFVPHRVVHQGADGLLTGYFEPLMQGSRTPTDNFKTPIYKRPADLVNLVDEAQRGAAGNALTHARKTATGTEPFATRADIEKGALKGKGLELLYMANPVDVFFLQIQGSGRIQLTDGTTVRVSYDGKNGHPYSSIGRYLIDKGILDANRMSLDALAVWLKADPARAQPVMWHNKSYVFFRELQGEEGKATLGVHSIPLTPGRSVAVDAGYHDLGVPIFVSANLPHVVKGGAFNRLMIAQDVGSAIKGPERGDLFFGSGPEAAKIAGVTKHPGRFHVLLPRPEAAAAGTSVSQPKSP